MGEGIVVIVIVNGDGGHDALAIAGLAAVSEALWQPGRGHGASR